MLNQVFGSRILISTYWLAKYRQLAFRSAPANCWNTNVEMDRSITFTFINSVSF